MSRTQLRYIFLDNGLGAALLNFLLNAAIAWTMFRGAPLIPFWGPVGIAADTIATSLILPFLTCLIVTRMANWHLRAGRLLPIAQAEGASPVLGWLAQRGTLPRALAIAVSSSLVLVPITLGALTWLGVERLELWPFVLFKAGFAVVDGMLVTSLIAFLALTKPPTRVGC